MRLSVIARLQFVGALGVCLFIFHYNTNICTDLPPTIGEQNNALGCKEILARMVDHNYYDNKTAEVKARISRSPRWGMDSLTLIKDEYQTPLKQNIVKRSVDLVDVEEPMTTSTTTTKSPQTSKSASTVTTERTTTVTQTTVVPTTTVTPTTTVSSYISTDHLTVASSNKYRSLRETDDGQILQKLHEYDNIEIKVRSCKKIILNNIATVLPYIKLFRVPVVYVMYFSLGLAIISIVLSVVFDVQYTVVTVGYGVIQFLIWCHVVASLMSLWLSHSWSGITAIPIHHSTPRFPDLWSIALIVSFIPIITSLLDIVLALTSDIRIRWENSQGAYKCIEMIEMSKKKQQRGKSGKEEKETLVVASGFRKLPDIE